MDSAYSFSTSSFGASILILINVVFLSLDKIVPYACSSFSMRADLSLIFSWFHLRDSSINGSTIRSSPSALTKEKLLSESTLIE